MARKTYLVALAIEIDTDDTSAPDCWGWNTFTSVKNFATQLLDRASEPTVKLLSCKDVEELPPTMYRGVPVSVFLNELKLGHIVQAIKNVRNATGLSLKEAKDLVDRYRSEHTV